MLKFKLILELNCYRDIFVDSYILSLEPRRFAFAPASKNLSNHHLNWLEIILGLVVLELLLRFSRHLGHGLL